MTPQQRDALKQALEQHSLSMAVKDAAPEDVAALPQDFAVPTYNANNQPLYDNQLFPSVNSVEDLVARGYATPDGQVTERGQMALSLRRVGALKEDYTLNDTGRAVLSKREDLLEPDNLSLYGKAEELNLDDDGRGAMARFSDGAKELWKATQNLGAALYEEAEPAMGAIQAIGGIAKGPAGVIDVVSGVKQQLETDYTPEQRAATRIRTEEAIKEFSDQGTYTLLGAGELMMRGAMSTPTGIAGGSEVDIISQAQKDANILATRQARERVLNDAANVSVSEAVDQLTGVTEFVKSYQQAADVLGPERTKEVVEQGKAMGLAGSILNPAAPEAAAFAVGFKAARGITAPISGSLLRSEQKAQQVLAKTKELTALQKQAADYQFAIKTVEQQAARAEETAARLSKRGFVDRANSQITAANAIRRQAQETGVKLGGLQDEITRVSDDIATMTKDATVADKFNQMMQKAKEVPYMPITMVGSTLEYVGRNMIGIDKGLSKLASKIGVDKAYNAMNKISSLSGLGTVGAAAGLGPAAFIPAAIKTAWSTAPFIEGAGKFINLVGKEAMKSRADINFWKRIYEMPNQGPVNRAIAGFMDTATLGGRVTDLGVRTTKGVLAAVPADLAFQYVGEGGKMDAGSIGEALSESVFFGGAGGGLGAITMGSKQKIRSLQNGNALNFYRTLEDPQQRVMFNGMPEDYRRAIGTFSATNPGARVMFTTIGGGGIDPNTNTIYINPNSSNPIKPLVTHEFMHHMMNNGIGEGIVAQLVGDGYQTGGILRTADGKYEPQYEAFKEEYVDRLRQQHAQMIKMREAIGDKIPANEREFQAPSEKYLAEEYFIESNVEDMLGLVESGKLGKMAGRMVINDKVRALGDSILNKSSILRDLHFKLGGVMDKNGKMVSGNGFLGGQMYQSPEIRRMFKKMVSDSVGRKGGFDQARVKAKEGVKLKINGKTDPILKSMVSFWEGDADGVPFLDKDGDFIPLKKETEEMRATAGLLLIDDQNKRQANGETIAEGQLVYNPDTQTWSGKYLTEDQIRILRLSGRFNNPQIRQLEMLNEAAKATLDPNAAPETRGNRFSIIYQAALGRNKKGKWRYDQIEPSLRDVVPYGVEISKKGNILIRIMSTNQMHANISKKAASKKGIQLYEGNIEAILRDVNRVIELHGEADGKPTDAYFKEKYGAAWESHKAFINSVFGNVGAGHKDINPLVASDKVDAVVKTYRLDRINKATQMVGSTNLPYQNNLVKINYLPEGEPILDENGEPKDLRYTPSYEDSQVRMPEAQRAMPEGEQTPTRFMPEATQIKRFANEPTKTPLGDTFRVESDGPLFRSVTQKDWDRIQDQGYLDSDQRYAVSKKEGVNMASSPLSAITYAPIGDNSVLLKINPSNISLHGYAGDQYIRTWDRIQLEDIEDVGKFIGGETIPSYMSQSNESDMARKMPEGVSPEDLNPVANKQEAQGLWADGKRMFALNEMDEKLTPITSKAMLDSYSADAIGWMEPQAQTRFMPEQLDSDYMKAVESGDVETQQRMVDEAAKRAGYAIKAYHGASQKLIGNKFDRSFIGEGSGVFRDGFSFATNKSKAESYSSGFSDGESVVSWWAREVNKILRSIPEDSKAKVWGMPVRESQWDTGAMDIDEYSIEGIPRSILDVADQIRDAEPEAASRLDDLSQKTPIKSKGGELYSVLLKLNNPRTIYTSEEGMATDAWGVRAKSDSDVILDLGQGEKIYYVYNPNNAKSADPITRDDSGNVIPLSKRFDVGSRDMRFMPEGDVEVKVVDRPDETTEQGTPAPDSDVQSLPLTGNPIPWDRMLSRQVRFMPESDRDAFPTMTPRLLAEIEKETPTLAAIHIDRMRVGEYMGIDLQGGMFYPTIKENLDNGVVWAFNSTGVARTVANRAAQNKGYVKLVLMQEGNVVGNKTFANIWFKILSDSVENKQISKALALTELNAARRTVYKTLEGKDVKKNPWVAKHADKWNSLEEAKEAILSMPQIERGATYFKKSKTTTKSEGEKIAYQALLSQKMAKLGFPDARKIVNDIEEPAFKGVPTGAAVAIIKFDPLGADEKIMTAKEAGVPEHMSYGYVLKGKPVAKLGYYQVVEETFPKTKGQIMTQQHTDFPIRASVPSKKSARGQIQYASAIANAAKLK